MEISCNKYVYCKRELRGERTLYLKTWKVNTTQSNKTLPTLSDDALPPAALLIDVVGWQTGEQCCQQEWEPSLEDKGLAKPQDDHRLILKGCQMPRMWIRVIWQEGRLAMRREEGREECQQKESGALFDQQALSSDRKTVQFNISKALI